MPDHIPKVDEIGATSAPLMSASFFIGDRCRAFNDDYMKCKAEANGRGELDCLKEGRKVTRCAASVYVFLPFLWVVWFGWAGFVGLEENESADFNRIKDINTHCLDQFNAHWDCLENNNHRMFECRAPEMKLNNCVFDKLVRLFLSCLPLEVYLPGRFANSYLGSEKDYPWRSRRRHPCSLATQAA